MLKSVFLHKFKIMANIRNLKKDINYVLGDIIEAVYIVEASQNKSGSKEGTEIIDSAISTFDGLIVKVNEKGVKDKSAHFKQVRKELEVAAGDLVGRLNKLG